MLLWFTRPPLGCYAPLGIGVVNQQQHYKRCNNYHMYITLQTSAEEDDEPSCSDEGSSLVNEEGDALSKEGGDISFIDLTGVDMPILGRN